MRIAPVSYNTVFRMALGCPVSWKTAEKVVRAVREIDGTIIDARTLCLGDPERWSQYLAAHPKANWNADAEDDAA